MYYELEDLVDDLLEDPRQAFAAAFHETNEHLSMMSSLDKAMSTLLMPAPRHASDATILSGVAQPTHLSRHTCLVTRVVLTRFAADGG